MALLQETSLPNLCVLRRNLFPDGKKKVISGSISMSDIREKQWFALWVYHNLIPAVKRICDGEDIPVYLPVRTVENEGKSSEEPLIPNLLFVKADDRFIGMLEHDFSKRIRAYRHNASSSPLTVDERSMEIFMLVVKMGAGHLETVDIPADNGDRIRVIDGMYKGAEGYIRRVHGTKRFIAVIDGVAAVAATHIPGRFIEKIQ